MKKYFSLFILFFLPLFSFATHVVGGTIMYRSLGGSSYEVTLRLYRNCSSGNPTLPNTVTIQVRDVNGNLFSPDKSITTSLDSTVPVPSYLPACISNPGLCYEEGCYTQIVNNFPAQPGGYHLYFQYCCRPTNTINIINPLSTGMSLYTFIPDATVITPDNSPRWNLAPPLFECQGTPMNYNYAATDADGDSLVFSYYTPYSDPAPTFPSGVATFTPITWVAGFGANNSCGGPNLTMNSQTGFVSGTPQNVGDYQHGVLCEEFRNGIKISEIRRDYPFVVVNCPPAPLASFFAPAVSCYGNTVQFTNNSMNATNYFWDFGDPSTTSDTSTAANPSWGYANPGTYTITLIADPNTGCADTTTMAITIEEVYAAFIVNDTLYSGFTSQFTDSSWSSDGSPMVSWTWDFGDASANSNLQNPTHVYSAIGNYTVTLTVLSANGCLSTVTQIIYVDLPNAIHSNEEISFSIIPNPSDGNFKITNLNVNENYQMQISDVAGRIILNRNSLGEKTLNLNMNVAPGIYFFRCIANGKESEEKIIVQ
ncbi:MAG: PKD domain-containing protein [Bacteroidetes bacterium]|nr:PKD domain-containing protein [Bacteroidota bacterium]